MGGAAKGTVVIRTVLAALIVGALVAGLWMVPGGASTTAKKTKTYSASDCAAIQNIKTPSSSNSSFGSQARAEAQAFSAAADKVQDKSLEKSLQGLSSFYNALGKANNVGAAALAASKKAKAYGKSLKVFVKATIACVSQITIPPVTIPSVTTPTTSSSSTTSTSSASTVPENSAKRPFTVAIIIWRTANSMLECVGSICQVLRPVSVATGS